MADSKETKLSIVLRTVDQATGKIKAINDRLDAITKPTRDFKKALADLREKSGLDDVISGFKGVGSALSDLLSKVALVGGVAGLAVHELFSLVNEFDELGDKAERFGVGVDFLAQMRYAAEKAGAPVEALDSGLQAFTQSLGQARAGTGRMAAFLDKVSPALKRQLVAAKSNEQAFDLLADAMAKLTDPAKRAALAQKTLGDSSLAPLFAKGAKGVKELRDRYLELAGSQEGAAGEAGKVDDAMHDLKASTDGIKAAIVEGLSPALKILVDQLRDWFTAHREDVKEWAKQIGEKLPGAVAKIVAWIKTAFEKVSAFVDMIGGLKNAAIAAGLVIAGPLLLSIAKLAVGLGGAISKAGQLGSALGGIGGAGAGGGGTGLAALGPIGLGVAGGALLSELTGGTMLGDRGGALAVANEMLAAKQRAARGQTDFRGLIRPDVSAQARAAVDAVGPRSVGAAADAAGGRSMPNDAKITVDFANVPRGTRVRTDPQSTADVDLSVGYQMGAL